MPYRRVPSQKALSVSVCVYWYSFNGHVGRQTATRLQKHMLVIN